ncbi:hypothetical protein EYF80_032649 [Liparis tanakae]|uniref:Uncharacterized protein n=1 Tax=Liparis tanakae TaxID=230148 RepID=A0A4Z2GUE8_9TELE|nr:hypothetical protein EYF80_032649 [Liparis tanakae]
MAVSTHDTLGCISVFFSLHVQFFQAVQPILFSRFASGEVDRHIAEIVLDRFPADRKRSAQRERSDSLSCVSDLIPTSQ